MNSTSTDVSVPNSSKLIENDPHLNMISSTSSMSSLRKKITQKTDTRVKIRSFIIRHLAYRTNILQLLSQSEHRRYLVYVRGFTVRQTDCSAGSSIMSSSDVFQSDGL